MGSYLKEKMNIEVTYISGKDVNEFRENIKENTCLIYLESPSSVVFSLQDINEISKLAKAHNINKLHNKIQGNRTCKHLFPLKKA